MNGSVDYRDSNPGVPSGIIESSLFRFVETQNSTAEPLHQPATWRKNGLELDLHLGTEIVLRVLRGRVSASRAWKSKTDAHPFRAPPDESLPQIIAAFGSGLLLYGFVGGTSFFRQWASWGRRRTDHEGEGSNDDVHICRVCKERAVARNEESLRCVERLREVEQPLQHRLSTLWMSRGQMEDADDDTGERFRKDEEGTKQDASVLQHLRRWPSIDSSHSSCQRLLRRTSYQNSLEEGGGATPQLVSSDNVEGQKVL